MDPHRLPRTVVPSRYDLRLEPDLASAGFAGEVSIRVHVHEPVTEIVLNAAELHIDTATFEVDGEVLPGTVQLDEVAERCLLAFTEPLPVGEGRLLLRFRGVLNDKLRGFYRSRYREAGEWRWLAATQFEATDARRAFPCWDEPDFKAVFSVTLVVDPDLQAISNTAVVDEREQPGRRVVRFADSIPMSTYLVAFVVGRLEATEPVMVGRTPVRAWCVPGKGPMARLGLDVAAFSLRFFEDYYGRPYPGDKLDLIAIPDFAAGAMENLGAITFRETALLVDESTATHREKERVASTVAHEVAHMWFGDLVTMRWWNGLWLNEAFATFMEMLAVDAYRPAWRRWTTFAAMRSAAFAVDGLHSSRPIEFTVTTPDDAEAMFDVLTYEKGAGVLRMLEQFIGPRTFRAGVHAYLDKHAFANTETTDLWQALGAASGLRVPEVMEGWVFRPGYPLVSVAREGHDLVFRQQRFCYLPLADDEAALPWHVPIHLRLGTADGVLVWRVLLDTPEFRMALPSDTRWVLVNEGGHGFYHARYEADLLQPLLNRLPDLEAIERFHLIHDAWALVLAGLMRLTDYLDLTLRFVSDRDRNVWSVLLGSFTALARIAEETDRPGLQDLIRGRLASAVAELGWQPLPGEDELTGQLRGDLLRAAGTLGEDTMVQALAARVYAAGAADPAVLSAAIAVVAHTGDATRYDDFLNRFRSARTPQEEQRYLLGLAGFRPAALVERTLQLTLDGAVRTQDAPLLLRALLLGTHSRAQAWEFFQANWERMAAKFPGPGIRRLCEGVLGLATPEWETEVRAFFRDRNIHLGGKTLEQFLEQLHVAVVLRQREGEALKKYLART